METSEILIWCLLDGVKTRSGGYLGQSPAWVRVPDGYPTGDPHNLDETGEK